MLASIIAQARVNTHRMKYSYSSMYSTTRLFESMATKAEDMPWMNHALSSVIRLWLMTRCCLKAFLQKKYMKR